MTKASVVERWTYITIGTWLVISPWILGFSEDVLIKWSSVLCGLALIVINAWELSRSNDVVKK